MLVICVLPLWRAVNRSLFVVVGGSLCCVLVAVDMFVVRCLLIVDRCSVCVVPGSLLFSVCGCDRCRRLTLCVVRVF